MKALPSIASSTIMLLIWDLYPNAFTTHMFIKSDIAAAFIRSAISLVRSSCDFDKMSRKSNQTERKLWDNIFLFANNQHKSFRF